MLIREWVKDLNNDIYLRSTYSNSGSIIYMGGTKTASSQLSSRRYSVVDATNGIKLKIIATSIHNAFGTDDYAVHEKYIDGQIVALLEMDFTGTLEEALEWSGAPQDVVW